MRLQHLRSLWLRQIEFLQSDGGITLKALGIRVTYVNNIQVSLVNVAHHSNQSNRR